MCKEGSGVPAAGSQVRGPEAQWSTYKQELLGRLHGYHYRALGLEVFKVLFCFVLFWSCWVFVVMHRLSLVAFLLWASLVVQLVKNPSANAGVVGSIPGSGGYPGQGNGKPLQYSCLKNPMDREAW